MKLSAVFFPEHTQKLWVLKISYSSSNQKHSNNMIQSYEATTFFNLTFFPLVSKTDFQKAS